MGLPIPEEYGGARGGDTVSYAIAIEELTRVDSSVAITVAAHTSLGTMPILLYGTEEQKRRWLPDLGSGRRLAAFRAHGAGGRVGRRSDADDRGARGRLVGRRRLEALHHERGHRPHLGRDDHRPHGRGRGLEPRRRERDAGLRDLGPMKKLGWRASDTRELSFEDCSVPEGTCWASAAPGSASSSRSSTAAGSRSPRWGSGSRRAPRPRVRVRAGREQFGKPISRFQAVRIQARGHGHRDRGGPLARYRAAWLKDQGRPFALRARQWRSSSPASSPPAIAGAALQIHGGFGYMEEAPISRLYRDQKILEIGEGTNEVQRMVIAATSACSATPDPHDRRSRSMTGLSSPALARRASVRHVTCASWAKWARAPLGHSVARRHRLPGGSNSLSRAPDRGCRPS